MVSDFIVQHPSCPFFQLTNAEWENAIKMYPELLQDDHLYLPRSATSFIELNGDNYFDNETILEQFERLFKLIKFKTEYAYHDIELLVDNATTHTAKAYKISQFRKNPGKPCPVDFLEWKDENNNILTLDCFFEDGKSKGLFEIAKELKLIPADAKSSNYLLPALVEIAKKHPAFDIETNLSCLANKYDIQIIYLPKFHSELSPIEGVWAHQKNFIRKNTDQTFPEMRKLLHESRDNLFNHCLIPKLWRRVWRVIDDYKNEKNFLDILRNHFGLKCQFEGVGHRQIQQVPKKMKNF